MRAKVALALAMDAAVLVVAAAFGALGKMAFDFGRADRCLDCRADADISTFAFVASGAAIGALAVAPSLYLVYRRWPNAALAGAGLPFALAALVVWRLRHVFG